AKATLLYRGGIQFDSRGFCVRMVLWTGRFDQVSCACGSDGQAHSAASQSGGTEQGSSPSQEDEGRNRSIHDVDPRSIFLGGRVGGNASIVIAERRQA